MTPTSPKYLQSKYLSEILLVQIVATYLVILGHSYPFITAIPDWISHTQVFIYCFHMPLFVWISGYLLVYTDQSRRNGLRAFCRKRFMKLIIPYIALTIIAFLPKFLAQQYLNDSLSLDAESIVRVFLVPRENIWGHFWFLPMIFILGIVGFAIDKLGDRLNKRISEKYSKRDLGRKILWLAIFLLSSLANILCYGNKISGWFSIDDLINLGWVFALGAFCGCFKVIEIIADKANAWRALTILILTAIAFAGWQWSTPIANCIVKMAIAVLMIYALTELCARLSKKLNLNKTSIYAQTFTIFILSWPCQAVINVVTERLLGWPWYFIMPAQFVAGVVGPMLLIKLIDIIERRYRTHYISILLGK